jgi:hypothetical protein
MNKMSNVTKGRKTKQKLKKVDNYKKPKKIEKYGTEYKKLWKIFFTENQKGGEKFLWAFLLVNRVEENVKNYKSWINR